MIGFQTSITRTDEHGVVRRPAPGDALGAALRGLYGEQPHLPDDMLRLLRTLDRPLRGH